MNDILQEPKVNLKFKIEQLLVFLMYAFTFLVYSFPNFTNYIGPLLAISMLMVVFTKYYYSVPILCLLGNNSLETIFLGRIQILYLALPLILLRFLLLKKKTRKISLNYFIFYFSVLAMLIHLLIFDANESIRTIIYTVLWLTAMVLVFNDFYESKKSINPIIKHIGISIFISALQFTVFTLMGLQGGVLYYENAGDGLSRYGVFGAGAGDPNCSGMYLLIGFFILLFYCKQLKWAIKIPMLACFVLPIFYTASATTFLFLIVVLLAYAVLVPSTTMKIKIVFAIILITTLVFVLIYFFDVNYMKFLKNEEISRFFEKLQQAQSGNLSGATTGRTDLWAQYINYYVNQPIERILFGGNSVQIQGISYGSVELVSHNTYIDFFIRFGLFGGVFLTGYVLYKVIHAFYIYLKTKKDTELCFLKLLVAGFSFTVSYFSGPLYLIIVIILLFLKYDDVAPKGLFDTVNKQYTQPKKIS